MIKKYIVNSEYENMRIDKFIRKYSMETSLSKLFSFIRKGEIKVNSKKVKENYRFLIGDKITYTDNLKLKISNNYENDNKIDFNILKKYIVFENNDLFIINKPNNIPMHKGDNHKYGLAEMSKLYFNSSNINFANRLDLETEGLVIGCKNLNILRKINEEIRNSKIEKKYVALIDKNHMKIGDEFTIDKNLLVVENKVIVSKEGKKSITKCKIIDEVNNKYLLDIKLLTGRKHQIRVHLSSMGIPIIGDKKYSKTNEKRMFLKCYKLKFLNYNFQIKKSFE